jgi:hypothetical protein
MIVKKSSAINPFKYHVKSRNHPASALPSLAMVQRAQTVNSVVFLAGDGFVHFVKNVENF